MRSGSRGRPFIVPEGKQNERNFAPSDSSVYEAERMSKLAVTPCAYTAEVKESQGVLVGRFPCSICGRGMNWNRDGGCIE